MITFLAGFLKPFVPLGFIMGAVTALWWPLLGRRLKRHLGLCVVVGLIGGFLLYWIASRQALMVEVQMLLYTLLALSGIFSILAIITTKVAQKGFWCNVGVAITFLFVILAITLSLFQFIPFASDQALSVITVLNTELILNIGAIIIGIAMILCLVPLTAHILFKGGRGLILAFSIIVSLFLVFKGVAESLLGMMRLEMIEITKISLSFVAKVVGLQDFMLYAQVVLFAILVIIAYIRRPRVTRDASADLNRSQYRKIRSKIVFELRWVKAAAVMVVLLLSPLLYYNLYASKPPKITRPTLITPDADGLIKIKIEEVKDGKLYRYAYITSDGTKVRFLVINRYPDSVKMSAVFDSCLICGDMGYNQEGNDVICLSCNVRIFVPSIGKPGGCNPIPFEYQLTEDEIIITAAELEKGAEYFSEVVEIEVKDPVTGAILINLKAPYHYDFKGHTFFFESQESFEKFKADPEKYATGLQTRLWRVQGYRDVSEGK